MAAIQTVVAPGMQGRVFTLLGSASSLMAPLSLAIAGPVADAFGVQVWYIVGGVASLVIGAGSFMVRPLMGIEDGARGSTPVSAAQPGEAVPAATPGSRAQPSAPWPV
jgi:DHA3 family macrolide efflux protein-like MFS transporter